jgi:hypothetical protein
MFTVFFASVSTNSFLQLFSSWVRVGVTYNQVTSCCNSSDKFDGSSGIHVLTLVRIEIASKSRNGCPLVAISN